MSSGPVQRRLQFVLPHYDLRPTENIVLNYFGMANEVFIITTETGKYVLKCCYKNNTQELVANEAALIQHLAREGVATPKLIPTKDGAPFFKYEGHHYVLSEFVDGFVPNWEAPLSYQFISESMRGMANFHNATENFEAPYESGRIDFLDTIAIRKWLDNLSVEMKTQDGSRKSIELLKPLLKEYYQLLDELEADLARTDLSALKKLYIHGDLHCFNMIFNHEKDRYISIVDFDFIREDYRLVDLLWTSHTTKWGYLVAQKYGKNALVEDFEPPESEMKAIEIEAIHLMVQEYRKYSELPSSELQHLPLLAKAFPFYNIRFFDFNNSEDECLQHINWFSWMIKNRLAYVDNIREAVSGL